MGNGETMNNNLKASSKRHSIFLDAKLFSFVVGLSGSIRRSQCFPVPLWGGVGGDSMGEYMQALEFRPWHHLSPPHKNHKMVLLARTLSIVGDP